MVPNTTTRQSGRRFSQALALCLTLFLMLCGFGCKKKQTSPSPTASPAQNASASPSSEGGNAGKLRTGLAVITRAADSASAGETDGKAQVESVMAAILCDAEDRVVSCVIDGMNVTAQFTGEGKLNADLSAPLYTKQELADRYGMKKVSSIGKEWYEQADAFAAYCVGKTASEIENIALDEGGHATEADLLSSATISLSDFTEVVTKAIRSAAESEATDQDTLRLGTTTSISGSMDAVADAEGRVEAASTYAALTLGADGRITSCVVDASQARVGFDQSGKLTSDVSADLPTKGEQGDAYGMKGASSIGREWYEQAASFAAYCVGKTPAEVVGVALDDSGHATDEDLRAFATISIFDFTEAIRKAAR